MNQTNTPPARNASLDLIKVLAMTFVMTLHTVPPTNRNPVCFLLATISGIAIPLFFMVSGFLLIKKNGDWSYSKQKILNIFKFSLFLTIPIAIINRIFLPIDWLDINAWLTDLIGPFLQKSNLLWVLWYLGAMCLIYLLLPAIHNLHKKFGSKFLILATISFATICNVCFSLNITIGFEQRIIQTFRIQNWILYFLIGATVHAFLPKIRESFYRPSKSHSLYIVIPIASAILYSFFLKYVSYPHGAEVEYNFGSAMCMAYSLATFICLLLYKPGVFISKWIKRLSRLFLPAFVLHIFVIYAVNKIIPETVLELEEYTYLIKLITVWTGTLSLSYLIMKVPVGKWIFRI